MKICFLLPTLGNSGGVQVVFKHADLLASKGHKIVIAYPFFPPNTDFWRFKQFFGFAKYIAWIPLNILKFNRNKYRRLYPQVKIQFMFTINCIPKGFDKYVSTWWEHMIPLQKLTDAKKINFIQGYDAQCEKWDSKTVELIKSTYRIKDINNLTISNYLADQIKNDGAKNVTVIYNNIDLSKFIPHLNNEKYNSIGVIYRSAYSKGFINFINYMRNYKSKDIRYYCIGFNVPPHIKKMFDGVYIGNSQEKMASFYNKIGLLIIPSIEEGFALPIVEAMSCGTLVAIKNIGIAHDLVKDGVNSFILDNHDHESIRRCIDKYMKLDESSKNMLYKNAMLTIKNDYTKLVDYYSENIIKFYEG